MCLPVLLDAAAKGVVLLVLGGLVVTAMRRSSAAARQVVWVATLAAILATPLVSALVPASSRRRAVRPETWPSTSCPTG